MLYVLDENLVLSKIKVVDGEEAELLWKKNLELLKEVKKLDFKDIQTACITDRCLTVKNSCIVFESGICFDLLYTGKDKELKEVYQTSKIRGTEKLIIKVRDRETYQFSYVIKSDPATR